MTVVGEVPPVLELLRKAGLEQAGHSRSARGRSIRALNGRQAVVFLVY